MRNSIAQREIPIGDPFQGIGPLAEPGTEGPRLLNETLSKVIGVLTVIAAIWFIFSFFIGAFQVLTAGGDKAKLEGARAQITHSLAGLVLVVAAVFLIQIIGEIIGVKILNPGDYVNIIAPLL